MTFWLTAAVRFCNRGFTSMLRLFYPFVNMSSCLELYKQVLFVTDSLRDGCSELRPVGKQMEIPCANLVARAFCGNLPIVCQY